MTDTTTGQHTADRPPVGLAFTSLLRADSVVILRNRVSTLVSILLPIVILVATSLGKNPSRLGAPATVVGLALTLGLITSCLLGYSLTLARDREIGVLQRLRVTPAPTWTVMTSRLLVQLLANLVAAVIVLVVGAVLHGLALSAASVVLALGCAALGAAVFLSMGQALVALVPSTTAINAIGRILFIILVLLGMVGATGLLGDTLQSIAGWTPVGALLTLFSDVLGQATWSTDDAYALLACAGYIVVFAVIGIRWFRWGAR